MIIIKILLQGRMKNIYIVLYLKMELIIENPILKKDDKDKSKKINSFKINMK